LAAVGILAIALNVWSLRHLRRSAEAAERAAEATRDSAAATLASLPVDFAVSAIVAPHGDVGLVRIEARHVSVWIHAVRLTSLSDDDSFTSREDVLEFVHPDDVPNFVHAGNAMLCRLPEPRPAKDFDLNLAITYSLDQDGRRLTAQRGGRGEVIQWTPRSP
jgi:hypothetical protein